MRRLITLVAVLMGSACGGGTPAPEGAPRPARGNANLITEQEIAAGSYQTALEAIQNLRPQMLIPRASTMTGNAAGSSTMEATSVNVVIYLDDVRLGEISALSTIPAQRVREIRYVNARDATTRYGSGHGSGAILVVSKK